MGKKEDAEIVLTDLSKSEEILACMLSRKDFGGIFPKEIKVKDANFWNNVKNSTSQIFPVIEKFMIYKISRLYFELGDYTIIFAPVNQTYSLISVIPALANMGLIDVEIENAKRKILTIMESKGE
jgi:hypothetical protein